MELWHTDEEETYSNDDDDAVPPFLTLQYAASAAGQDAPYAILAEDGPLWVDARGRAALMPHVSVVVGLLFATSEEAGRHDVSLAIRCAAAVAASPVMRSGNPSLWHGDVGYGVQWDTAAFLVANPTFEGTDFDFGAASRPLLLDDPWLRPHEQTPLPMTFFGYLPRVAIPSNLNFQSFALMHGALRGGQQDVFEVVVALFHHAAPHLLFNNTHEYWCLGSSMLRHAVQGGSLWILRRLISEFPGTSVRILRQSFVEREFDDLFDALKNLPAIKLIVEEFPTIKPSAQAFKFAVGHDDTTLLRYLVEQLHYRVSAEEVAAVHLSGLSGPRDYLVKLDS